MDVLVDYLAKYNFTRINSRLCKPVVVNCVPGAGKSSVIRELVRADSRFIGFTAGVPDLPDISGAFIEKWTGDIPEGKFVLLDEYTLLDTVPEVFAVFGDPLQGRGKLCLRADFTCNYSHRFGSATGQLLRELGFDVRSTGSDSVQILDIFQAEPEDIILYFEEEIGILLCRHQVEAFFVDDVQGKTFERVTFVTSENSPILDRVRAFECLTRHRSVLRILCPNATYSST